MQMEVKNIKYFIMIYFLEIKFKDALEDVNREIEVMKKLNHDNCIKLYEVISNDKNDKLYLGNIYIFL